MGEEALSAAAQDSSGAAVALRDEVRCLRDDADALARAHGFTPGVDDR